MATRKKGLPPKGSRISRNEAEDFLRLYNQLGTFQAVANITGRSHSSVSRWVKILQAEAITYQQPNSSIPIILNQR